MTTLLLAAIAGYLVGSVSFSRIVAARVLPDEEIVSTTYEVGGRGFESEAVGHSPAAVRHRAGDRAGGLATIGDIGKAVVATGVTWLLLDRDAAAAAGVGVVLGHVAPLYHRFRGAFGQSPIIGATLVLSPLGLPAAIVASLATTLVAAELVWVTMLWTVFLVPWGVVVSDDAFTWFAVGANGLYLARMLPQIRQRIDFRRRERPSRAERMAEIRALGDRGGSTADDPAGPVDPADPAGPVDPADPADGGGT